MGNLLDVRNLRVSIHTYAGEVKAVRDISFSMEDGEILAIVGESGCGKSMTAKAIMGLVKQPPGEIKPGSEILFDGKSVGSFTQKQLREYRGKQCAMIFQDPMTSLNPTMRIGEQIAENILIHEGGTKKEALKQAVQILEKVGIDEAEKRLRQYPHELSGGMRQRVMIAIAFACRPKLLIADEPTTALDVTIQSRVIELIRRLHEETKTSVILITHDMGVVANIAKKVIVMYAGQIVESGSSNDIFYSPQHPYTKALLNSVPRMTMENKKPLPFIKGTPPDLIAPPEHCAFAERCGSCMNICLEKQPDRAEFTKGHHFSCWQYLAQQSANL